MKNYIPTIGVTVCVLGLFVFLAVTMKSCNENLVISRNSDLKKSELCLDRGGSVVSGPNNVTQCLMVTKK